jgi:hypothetical protein
MGRARVDRFLDLRRSCPRGPGDRGWDRLTVVCHLRYGAEANARMTRDILNGELTAFIHRPVTCPTSLRPPCEDACPSDRPGMTRSHERGAPTTGSCCKPVVPRRARGESSTPCWRSGYASRCRRPGRERCHQVPAPTSTVNMAANTSRFRYKPRPPWGSCQTEETIATRQSAAVKTVSATFRFSHPVIARRTNVGWHRPARQVPQSVTNSERPLL